MAKNFSFVFNIDGKIGSGFIGGVKTASTKLLQLRDESKFVRAEQKRLNSAYDSGAISIGSYTERARALEVELTKIKEAQTRVSDLVQKQSKAQASFGSAADSLIMTKATITAMSAPLTGAIQTAARFEAAMDKVGAITQADAADMQKLTETARELGEKTQFSASQSAEAMSYLGMAGWKANEIIAGMPGLLNLAAAGGTDLARTADIISDDLTAFGLSAEDAGHMADVFAYTITNSNTNVEMMGETMKYAAPVAKAFGTTMEETAALTGLMANSGIKASQAGTALRAGFLRLAGPPKAARKAMAELGMSLTDITQEQKEAELALKSLGIEMSDTNGPKKMANIIAELRDKTADLGEEEKLASLKAIFGTTAATGWLAVLDAGPEKFAEFTAALEKSDGAAANMAKRMQDNALGATVRLQSAMESFSISIGSTFLPAVADITDKAAVYAGELSRVAAAHPELIHGTVTAAAAMAGLILTYKAGKVVYTGINLVKTTYNLLTDAEIYKEEKAAISKTFHTARILLLTGAQKALNVAKAAGTAIENGHAIASARAIAVMGAQRAATMASTAAQWALNAALTANPIGMIIVGIGALVAAGWALYKNWDSVTKFVSEQWQAAADTIKLAFEGAIRNLGYAVGYIETMPERIGAMTEKAGAAFWDMVESAKSWGLQTLENIIAGIINLPDRLMGIVENSESAGEAFIKLAGEWGLKAKDALINYFVSLPDGLASVVSDAWGRAKSLFSAGRAEAAGRPIAANASGGIYAKGAFLSTLAEEGPEAVIPIKRGDKRALSLYEQTGQMMGLGYKSGAPSNISSLRTGSEKENTGDNANNIALLAKKGAEVETPMNRGDKRALSLYEQPWRMTDLNHEPGILSSIASLITNFGQANTGKNSDNITFAPVINIQGNANSDTVRQITQQVKTQCDNFVEQLRQLRNQERRLSYE